MASRIPVGIGYYSKEGKACFDEDDKWRPAIFERLAPYVFVEPVCLDAPPRVTELRHLCGYILFSDSPYDRDCFTTELQREMPWLPAEARADLDNEEQREHFVERVFALYELNELWRKGLTRGGLIAFHSRYKLLLLAHSQPAYRELGPFVAGIEAWSDLEAFAVEYRRRLMSLLSQKATRRNHTNVLMHVQGYFRPYLSSPQRQELANEIDRYRRGELSLAAPVTRLKRYMEEYPDDYLSQQRYFSSCSEEMSLRYGG